MRYRGIIVRKNGVSFVVEGENSYQLQQSQQELGKDLNGIWVEFSVVPECYNYNGAHIGKDCPCRGGDIRDVAIVLDQ